MTKNIIDEKINEYRELSRMKAELEDAMDSIKMELIEAMSEAGEDKLEGMSGVASYKAVESSRFDSKLFKARYPELYASYCKTQVAKRFTVK